MRARMFTTAIVLGTAAGIDLSPQSRDTRVLTILLLLRHLARKCRPKLPLHVIGENAQDATALLALSPTPPLAKVAGQNRQPDYVNTQAIIARALVSALAYPLMHEALSEVGR